MSETMADKWIIQLFTTIDSMQANALAAYFADDGLFRFGNADPVRGRQAIEDANAAFFSAIGGLQHRITGVWRGQWAHGSVISVEAEVIYTRLNGTQTDALPVTSTLRMQGDQIKDYRIFMDNSSLFVG